MEYRKFELVSKFKPAGDQMQAIDKLCENLNDGLKSQILLGVTGSGKTFTMANVIAKLNRPTLVIAHNKTLAAQLCNEFREFFPNNRVEFFVSYYDYYQPEALLWRLCRVFMVWVRQKNILECKYLLEREIMFLVMK